MTFETVNIDSSRLRELYSTVEEHIYDHEERIKMINSIIKTIKSAKIKEVVIKLTKKFKSVSSPERIYILLLTHQLVTFNLEVEQILEISQPKANHNRCCVTMN